MKMKMIALCLFASACGHPVVPGVDRALYARPKLAVGTDLHQVSLSIMPTATVEVSEAILFEGGDWLKTRKLGHSAVLVCHPSALLMFDTGLGRDIDLQFEEMPLRLAILFPYEAGTPAVDQLAKTKFCAGRPLRIAVSHLHWDHASGIEDFPKAQVWVRPEERARAAKEENSAGYLSGQFDAKIDWRDLTFPDGAYESYPKSLDFFGDGVVIFVPLAGHTDGSTGMFVNLGQAGRFYFTGDITWSLEGFVKPAHKFWLMRSIVDWNLEVLDEEIQRIHRLKKRNPDLHVIPAHDYAAYEAAAVFPKSISGVRSGS